MQQNAVDIATRIATIHSISQTLDRSLRHNQERYEKIRTILELIKKDGSGGMHNYRRTKALLRESEFELLYSGLQKYATDTYENMRENMKRYLSMKTAN